MKPLKFLDNKRYGSVCDELKENIGAGSKLSVISAYFTIFAFEALKTELAKIDNMRFIFTEPTFIKKDKELTREYYIERLAREKAVGGNEFEIKLRNEMRQAAIAKECAQWLEEKVKIKSLRRANPAQPRLIYIDNRDEPVAINGTVDFTTDGLGITPSKRIDNNTCMYGKENTTAYLQMFNDLWNDNSEVEDVKALVLEQMKIFYKENTPEFIYFITLYNIFTEYLDELTEDKIIKTRTGFKDTMVWEKLYKFQKDGAIGAIDKIEKYNGCILADSVGLGKTFTALAVIKYYELRNDRVLVLVPKRLRDNWTVYTQNDKRNIFAADRFNYDVLNHTDLNRTTGMSGAMNLATVNWSNYDLVVIDESHNFRNNEPVKGRKTRYEILMDEIIKAGVKTKVLMLSATPVNNRLNDIKNQIDFITEGKSDAFAAAGLANFDIVLRTAQTVFNRWSNLPEDSRTTETFVDMMKADYFKLLETVTIARSRKHIEKYYNLDEIGKFPLRLPPKNIYSEIDLGNGFPPIGEVNKQINKLTLCLYSPMSYLMPEKRDEYAKKYDMKVRGGQSVFKQVDREQSLVGLMRVNLLKRMESSIYSFGLTVDKILGKIIQTIARVDEKQNNFDIDFNIEDIDTDDTELEDLLIGKKVKVLLQDIDLIKWRQDLVADRDNLTAILASAKKVTPERDAKLNTLKDLVYNKIKDCPVNDGNKKVVIFTAFADTASYIYKHLSAQLKLKDIYSAIVTGSGENNSTLPMTPELKRTIQLSDLNSVLTLFSPISKDCDKVFPEAKTRIDVLIGTDCISEGQNLQDCDYLINYDIHWNPVRIIQRFGRIDRIGSVNEKIQLVNFWPMQDLDEYINLKQRVQGRMVLLDVSATGEENLIDASDNREMKDLEYRKKQLQRLQTEVVDLEDVSGGISITDLTFTDFKLDLMGYMKENVKSLEEAPAGMYAVAEISESLRDIVKPGIIFTLRQVAGAVQTKEQNPLKSYYMLYVTDDGEVKLSFMQVKKILDYYKKICTGQRIVLAELVAEFNKQTGDGRDMRHYSELLSKAVENLVGKKQEIGVASLFSKGGTTLQASYYDGVEDFELITFLIIK